MCLILPMPEKDKPIPDTIFTVRAADGHSVDEIMTDSQGRATLSNLLPGVYEVSEKSVPAPWLMDAPSQLVTLYPNRDHTIYFENHKKPTLTVNKVDSITGSPIKGAKFEVWYGSNNTTTGELNSLGTFFSDENGQFFIGLLRDSWYKVTELAPAAGYTIKEPATQEFYIKGVDIRKAPHFDGLGMGLGCNPRWKWLLPGPLALLQTGGTALQRGAGQFYYHLPCPVGTG